MTGVVNIEYQQFNCFFLQATILQHIFSQACPSSGDKALRQVLACTRKIIEITNFTNGSVSVWTIQDYCETNATKEIQCAEKVVEDCRQKGSTARRILDKALSVNGIRNSVTIICHERQALASVQSCLSRYQDQVSQCILRRFSSYKDKVSNLSWQGYSTRWEGKAYKLLCQYVNQVKECQISYHLYCGIEVSKMFDAMVDATMPPVCSSGGNNRVFTQTARPGPLPTTRAYLTARPYGERYGHQNGKRSNRSLVNNKLILLAFALPCLAAKHF